MSDTSQGDGWWIASDDKWYPPELHPDAVAAREAAAAAEAAQQAAVPQTPVPPTTPQTPPFTEPVPPTTPQTPAFTEPVPPTMPTMPAATAPATMTRPAATVPPATALPTPTASTAGPDRRPLILGVVAAVLLIGLGFLAWRFLGASGSSGGAASPEAAVQQLIDSIAEGDAVGLVDVFDPDEIDAWFGSFAPAIDASADAQGAAGTGADDQFDEFTDELFSAFDIEVSGPGDDDFEFIASTLDADGRLASVRTSGIEVVLRAESADGETVILGPPADAAGLDLDAIDGAGFELRDRFGGLEVSAWAPGQERVEEFADNVHLDLVTVEKDGSWYISLGYSMMEAIRTSGELGRATPDFGRAFRMVDEQTGGAESPEAAVEALMQAVERLDYDEMIDLTDPLGLPMLHDYQPSIDASVDQRDLSEASRELDLEIGTLEMSTSDWNERTLVQIDRIGGRIAGGTFELDTRTWCAEAVSSDGETASGCAEDAVSELLDDAGLYDTDAGDIVPDSLGFVVVERNGRWYFDPLGTLGRMAEQVAETAGELDFSDALNESASVTGFDGFIAQRGPIASLGTSATAIAESGVAAVAVDLAGLDVPAIDAVVPPDVALVRIESASPSSFTGAGARPADPVEWVVVHAWSDDPLLPAVALETDSAITVTVERPEIVTVTSAGLQQMRIDDDGRPVVLAFDDTVSTLDFRSDDATFETVSSWEDYGVIRRDGPWANTSGDPTWGDYVVVTGAPGASFELATASFDEPDFPEPDPTDEPEPFDDPQALGDFADARVNRFVDVAAAGGFDVFAFDQSGGWFDGCGPSNPEATSHAFEDSFGDLLLVTTYLSATDAEAAFVALTAMQSPCDGFPGLRIDEIALDGDGQAITITLSTEDAPDEPFYEYYALRGDTIVVATGATVADLQYGATVLDGYDG